MKRADARVCRAQWRKRESRSIDREHVLASLLRHIAIPVFVVIEQNVIDDLSTILARHHLRFDSFGVISGPGPTQKYAQNLINELSRHHRVTQTCVCDNTQAEVERVAAWKLNDPVDVVVAVGGGRVLDVAKAACAPTHQTLILIPTSISSDSIASPVAVIKHDQRTRSLPGQPPLGIVVDLAVMRDVPLRLLRAGVGDLMSKLSASFDWRLARDYRREPHDAATEAMARLPAERMLKRHFPCAADLQEDEGFLRELAEGLVLSGIAMGISANSRPSSGSEHMISHALDQLRPGGRSLHGEQVLVATFFTLQLQGQADAWQHLRDLAEMIGLPHHPEHLAISRELFLDAVAKAPTTRPGRFSILDVKKDSGEIERAYDLAYPSVLRTNSPIVNTLLTSSAPSMDTPVVTDE